jgi:hypothetical protein
MPQRYAPLIVVVCRINYPRSHFRDDKTPGPLPCA